MKAFLALIFCLFAAVFASLPPTYAPFTAFSDGGEWARAATHSASFYPSGTNDVFYIPKGFCVRVLREDGNLYFASYAEDDGPYKKIEGYCKKEDFTPLSSKPETTFLYRLKKIECQPAYPSANLTHLPPSTLSAAYYGYLLHDGNYFSYVGADGAFGYVNGVDEELILGAFEEIGASEAPTNKKPSPKNVNAPLIAAIIILSLFSAAVITLFFIGRRKRKI